MSEWRDDWGYFDQDNDTLELKYVQDEWYELDEYGIIKTRLFIKRDKNGEVSQVSVLKDNQGYNITREISFTESDEELLFLWDLRFPFEAIRLSSSLEKEISSLDGQTVVLYSVREEYPSPVEVPGLSELVTGIMINAYYEPESGKVLLSEHGMLLADNEVRRDRSVELILWESGVEPPAEVLDYLDVLHKDTH